MDSPNPRTAREMPHLVVIGSGTPALAVARELVGRARPRRVSLIDTGSRLPRRRPWLLWGEAGGGPPALSAWTSWSVTGLEGRVLCHTPDRPLLLVADAALRRHLVADAAVRSRLAVLRPGGPVQIAPGPSGVRVAAGGRVLEAGLVVDLRAAGEGPGDEPARILDHYTIELDRGGERLAAAGPPALMDLRPAFSGLGFVVALPLPDGGALLRSVRAGSTRSSVEHHRNTLLGALVSTGVSGRLAIRRAEHGWAPLAAALAPRFVAPDVLAMPAATAVSTPVPGCALTALVASARHLAAELDSGRGAARWLVRPPRTGTLDRILLARLRRADASRTLLDLFASLDAELLLRQLTGDGSVGDEIAVLRALEAGPATGRLPRAAPGLSG